ncbi:MarR family protein [Actinopolymorpha cephalotaxi]|uniref:MarR family protein n=1 Tax=Actinopolymorpha cephalotaxi TaxID=504797 RepID=A0A1I2YZC4_9ACTN|nr:MarR family transcriptional regulator [Actinopolymorpha cephalotaxi]NYH81788.1 putative transcriptional regulator [Actinopolymorpha cephalotaxi]SFH31007.1 MarR family protein [Actinopolymorpha cephalotaxi]
MTTETTRDAGPAAERDEEKVRRFVEHMAMVFEDWGFPRMAARVLLTMMAADEETLTAGELAERLEVSAAAISGAVRYLQHLGMLSREPVPGSRTHRYRLPDDVWYETSINKRGALANVAALADEGARSLGGSDTPSGRRMEQMRDFYTFIDGALVDLMAKWEAERTTKAEHRAKARRS